MERQPTRPVPIPTSSRKKKAKKNELDLALESIRQVAEGEEWDGKVTLLEKAEVEPMEKLEKVECFEPEDYDKFGVPKPKREEVSDEQFELDTKEMFEDNAQAAGNGFMRKIERFNQLMAHWKTLPIYDPNVKADLEWLEENVAPYLGRREREPVQQSCPFHPLDPLKVLNPEAEFGPLYCKCPEEGCPVWCTTETAHIVLPELIEHTHPEVRAKITEIRCKCSEVPRMKLSRTDKNKNRVFLTCGQNPFQIEPCDYFQWMHAPLWKPKRPIQPTLDRWQKTPVGESLGQKRMKRPQRIDFSSGFKPPVFGESPKPAKSFEQLCDEQNAARTKHNMAPYSYDTYRQYGLGIF